MIEIIPNWHPAFVHFPIAFATAAVLFVAAGKLFRAAPWAQQCLAFGRWMLWAAALTACIAAAFGWFAYNSVKHDEAGHAAMTLHRNWALATTGALVVLALLEFRSWQAAKEATYGSLILLVATWMLVFSTAWHGGEVVYRHGLGVLALPVPEGTGHFHEHGEEHDEHNHVHDDAAHDTHDAGAAGNAPVTDAISDSHKKPGHTHPPGTPPHKD